MKLGKNRIIRHLENLIEKKPYDDYLCVDKNIIKAIVEILKNG